MHMGLCDQYLFADPNYPAPVGGELYNDIKQGSGQSVLIIRHKTHQSNLSAGNQQISTPAVDAEVLFKQAKRRLCLRGSFLDSCHSVCWIPIHFGRMKPKDQLDLLNLLVAIVG